MLQIGSVPSHDIFDTLINLLCILFEKFCIGKRFSEKDFSYNVWYYYISDPVSGKTAVNSLPLILDIYICQYIQTLLISIRIIFDLVLPKLLVHMSQMTQAI